MNTNPSRSKKVEVTLEFNSSSLAQQLYGEHDSHLKKLEELFAVNIISRSNTLKLSGDNDHVKRAEAAIHALWKRLESGLSVEISDIISTANFLIKQPKEQAAGSVPAVALKLQNRSISARTDAQVQYLNMMAKYTMIFAVGPAGTGKTFLAVAKAVSMLQDGKVEKIILSRPAVEAGERLGFLPGDMREKIDPYLRPLYDALHYLMPADMVMRKIAAGEIEIAPLAFMRGRTLAHAFVIVDEAQNTTAMQMKMLLTRLGEGSRMIINGDLSQVDLPDNVRSGLSDALEILQNVDDIGIMEFKAEDITRHPLVGRIVSAYDKRTARQSRRTTDKTDT